FQLLEGSYDVINGRTRIHMFFCATYPKLGNLHCIFHRATGLE
ncbi:hypothetical protein MIMGU_mgv11b0235051mg, partial [Erythranthe guttata]